MRTEKDYIGELSLRANTLYGIHSMRACHNFPNKSSFKKEWYMAMGTVKLACYTTIESYLINLNQKYPQDDRLKKIHSPTKKHLEALKEAAIEVSKGEHFDNFIVPSQQGGAGTSINMNINEIIANRALQIIGHRPGEYSIIDPIEDANLFQSTNDTVPTALHIAIMRSANTLEQTINEMRSETEGLEKEFRHILRPGYTQMQEAVPSSFGRLFSTYSDAFSRDWWRVSKCFERIKLVNLGGSATGSSIAVPRYFVMEVTRTLQKTSGLPVTRSENLYDTTSNHDAIVEIHAILKALAVNLEKMASDIRLLSSDIAQNQITIPARQTGSSIMPGKVNPVIAEYLISIAHKVYSNDVLITSLCAQGCLELNAYLPSIGDAVLESFELLISACQTAKENMLKNLSVNNQKTFHLLLKSPSITTALLPYIGYRNAEVLAKYMKENDCDIFEANKKFCFLDEIKLHEAIQSDRLLKGGFNFDDL